MEFILKRGQLKMQLIEGWQDIGLIIQLWNLSGGVAAQGQGSIKLNRLRTFLKCCF